MKTILAVCQPQDIAEKRQLRHKQDINIFIALKNKPYVDDNWPARPNLYTLCCYKNKNRETIASSKHLTSPDT